MLIRTITVDSDHRIKLPNESQTELGWIRPGMATDCWILPGAEGGIQIVDADSDVIKRRTDFIEKVSPPPRAEESGQAWFSHLRLLTASWQISISSGRFKLPADISGLGLLDRDEGSVLVVIVAGAILEIWNQADFRNHLQRNRGLWMSGDRDGLLDGRNVE